MIDEHDPPHETFEPHVPQREEVERVWREYWAPILKDGGIDRLKGELYDAWWLVNEARQVYHHATCGLSDDLTASAEGIIAIHNRYWMKRDP